MKIWNDFAHKNITPLNENGLLTGIIGKNQHGRIVDLEIEFNNEEL